MMLSKNVNNKKCAPKLKFFNEKAKRKPRDLSQADKRITRVSSFPSFNF